MLIIGIILLIANIMGHTRRFKKQNFNTIPLSHKHVNFSRDCISQVMLANISKQSLVASTKNDSYEYVIC